MCRVRRLVRSCNSQLQMVNQPAGCEVNSRSDGADDIVGTQGRSNDGTPPSPRRCRCPAFVRFAILSCNSPFRITLTKAGRPRVVAVASRIRPPLQLLGFQHSGRGEPAMEVVLRLQHEVVVQRHQVTRPEVSVPRVVELRR
jgi:hypothetical protein